jgi:micrococcal nuclease
MSETRGVKRNGKIILASLAAIFLFCCGCLTLFSLMPARVGDAEPAAVAESATVVSTKERLVVVWPTLAPASKNDAASDKAALIVPVTRPATAPVTAGSVTPAFATDVPVPGSEGAAGELVAVVRVMDGDTIEVRIGNQNVRIRYIGMDTPERGQPFFAEATAANEQLVAGQIVILVKDVSETDRYGRLLRYVYLQDGTFVNAELVRLGYAQVATFPPDVRRQALLLELQREAREAGRGLWGPAIAGSPSPEPTYTIVPTASSAPPTPLPTSAPPTSLPPTILAPAPTDPPPTSPPPTAAPTQAPVATITLISLTSPAGRNSNATLVIEAASGAVCDPGVIYKSGESRAAGLEPKTAGADGRLSWTWRVGGNTTFGTWTVYVVCNPGGRMQWPFVVQ